MEDNLVAKGLMNVFKGFLESIDLDYVIQSFLERFDLESVLERILTKIIKEDFKIEDYFMEKSTLHGSDYYSLKKVMKEQIESIIGEKNEDNKDTTI